MLLRQQKVSKKHLQSNDYDDEIFKKIMILTHFYTSDYADYDTFQFFFTETIKHLLKKIGL